MTNVSLTGIPDTAYDEVKTHFGEKDLVDLTLIISVMNAWNRMAISFRHGPAKRTKDSV